MIVTTIEPGKSFYPAEAYHQDFLAQNPTYPYIVINDLPKVEALKRRFPELYRTKPVLVASSATNWSVAAQALPSKPCAAANSVIMRLVTAGLGREAAWASANPEDAETFAQGRDGE